MVYRSVDYGHPSTIALGYAFSDDGIKWTRSSHNPVIRGPEVFAKKGFWYTALAYHDDTYYLYIEGQPGKISETSVFVATHKGPLAKE